MIPNSHWLSHNGIFLIHIFFEDAILQISYDNYNNDILLI